MTFTELMSEWSALVAIVIILTAAVVLRVLLKVASKRIVRTIVSGVQRVKKDERLDDLMLEQRLTQRTRTIA